MIYFIGTKVNLEGVENSTIFQLQSYFKDKEEIGFDTETTGFDPYVDVLLSYQLGDLDNQFVVDALLYPIGLVKDLLLSKTLIIHNAKFDLKFLYHKGIYPQKVYDTYLGECVLHKGNKTIRKSLEAAVFRYFNYSLTKSTRGKIFREQFSLRVVEYCAEDVKFLIHLKGAQYNLLKRQDLLNSINLENLFVKVLTYIEYCGIYIDSNLWSKKILQDRVKYESALLSLDNWILDNKIERFVDTQLSLFNSDPKTTIKWSSPKQVAELFNILGIDTKVTDDKTGELKDSVEAEVIQKQINKSTIIPIYLQYKKFEKTLSTYGVSVLEKIHPKTNRIHTQFTQIMSTGRLSSGGKIGDQETINLQNIPALPDKRELGKVYERDCFVAEEGNVLINADYSSQENIVFANQSLDKDLLDFYEKDLGDIHAFVASRIFPELKDIPLKEIKTKYKNKRQIAKSAGFAILYGGNGSTIAENLNISIEEGDAVYQAYFSAFPGIATHFKKVANHALQHGYILINSISGSKTYIYFFDQYKKLDDKVNRPSFWEKYREEKIKDSILFKDELRPLVSKYFKMKGNICRLSYNVPVQG